MVFSRRVARRLTRLANRRTDNALLLIALILIAGSIPLAVPIHQVGGNVGQAVIVTVFAVVGWIVARHEPRNAIGWLLLAVSLGLTLSLVAGDYAVIAFRQGHPGLPLARLAVVLTNTWVVLLFALPIPLLIFPDGRWPRGFWRLTVWAYCAIAAATVGSLIAGSAPAFDEARPKVDSSGALLSQDKSSGFLGVLLFLFIAAIALAWAARLFSRFHHATGDVRQQYKWLLSGAAIALVSFGTSAALSGWHAALARVVGAVGYLAITALPIGLAIGILRYRLYEVDRLISRTVSYAVVTGLLLGVYIGLVELTTKELQLSSPIAIAAATLAAVAIFSPLRKRVQHLVDRRFNRTRYRAEEIAAAFRASLHNEYELDDVSLRLISTVRRVLEPREASVWLTAIDER